MASKNILFNNPDSHDWYSSVGSNYHRNIIDFLLLNPDKYEEINEMQRLHSNLYKTNTNQGAINPIINTNDLVKQYLDKIKQNYSFVNQLGISKGRAQNRYRLTDNPQSGDNEEKGWMSEGLYGAQTDDRRVFGRDKDYSTQDLVDFNETLESAGLETYLDPEIGYYMFRQIPSGGFENREGKSHDNEEKVKKSQTLQKDWLKLYPKQKSSYPGWSDWIPLTAKKLVDDFATIRTGNLERQKAFPKVEAPQEYAKITDAYALRQLFEKQKQEALARAGYNPTSDLALNIKARVEGEKIASDITDKQVALKSQEFAETSKLVQDVANRNKLAHTEAANRNAQINAAARNSLIDSRIKQNERLASTLGTYIGDMYTNFGEYLKTKRLNENARKREQALSTFNLERVDALKPFYDLLDKPQTWNKLDKFRQALEAEELTGFTADELRIWNEAQSSGNPYENPEFVNLLVSKLKAGTSDAAKRYRSLYQQDLSLLEERATHKINISETQLRSILSSIDTYVTNQWGWNPQSRVRKSVLSAKQGGTIGDRFSRLEKIRQKEQLSVRENTQKRNKMISDNLNKQLDRISKEELALLRAIFK